MSEELARERIEIYANAEWTKPEIRSMAKQLLAEMDKPKDDVWKDAPEWADVAEVCWRDKANTKHKQLLNPLTREIPKTRARQIAEKEGHGLAEKYGWNASAKELVTNVMESALAKYAEELEEKEANQ